MNNEEKFEIFNIESARIIKILSPECEIHHTLAAHKLIQTVLQMMQNFRLDTSQAIDAIEKIVESPLEDSFKKYLKSAIKMGKKDLLFIKEIEQINDQLKDSLRISNPS